MKANSRRVARPRFTERSKRQWHALIMNSYSKDFAVHAARFPVYARSNNHGLSLKTSSSERVAAQTGQ